MNHCQVSFVLPEGRVVETRSASGITILEAARAGGLEIQATCAGRGRCGHCRVQVEGKLAPPSPVEQRILTPGERARGIRLACQARLEGDLKVILPKVAAGPAKILTAGTAAAVPVDSGFTKKVVILDPATLEDVRGDYERLRAKVEMSQPPLAILRQLAAAFRQGEGKVTVASFKDQVLSVEPGDVSGELYGMAFDIGTTTVVGSLLDLRTGRELAVSAARNGQAVHGADVIARIQFAQTVPKGLQEMQKKVIQTLNTIIADLLQEANVKPESVYGLSVVGNTCMQHLLLAIDPSPLGTSPYVPVFQSPLVVEAGELGLQVNPQAKVLVLPNIAGFVGADTVAVIMAAGLDQVKEPVVAVDIGTNGEIVVARDGQLWACSTAAGPAFEGAQITCGMGGTAGAIEGADVIDGELKLQVIDGEPARGICGSGLIDLIAVLLEAGIIDETGRMLSPDELPDEVPADLRRRVVAGERGVEFILTEDGENPVVLTQGDVRELQLAKGAIYAGIKILMNEAGLAPQDLSQVILAGAFGNYVRKESAIAIGLLPIAEKDKIVSVGNAARMGARMALLSQEVRDRALRAAAAAQYVELSGRLDFQMEFADAMLFPRPGGHLDKI
ncbi:MAG: DUF4445 domain-containing protein [Firmicutes bacterium]|nr:DUF4445 domain-containing protein [Bacillota bacterium]